LERKEFGPSSVEAAHCDVICDVSLKRPRSAAEFFRQLEHTFS